VLARGLADALFAGPDMCFDEEIKQHIKPTSSKQSVRMVLCNERVEIPRDVSGGPMDHVRYVGTMALHGEFSSSYTEGLTGMDMETRLFDYGFEIKIDSQDEHQPSFPGQAVEGHREGHNMRGGKRCTYMTPMNDDTDYRKKLLEVYGLYWRTRQKQIAHFSPCMPSPSMDFRESVEPSTGKIRYGHVSFFDTEIAIDDGEVKWKSTRDMFQCKRVWPLGSFIVKRDSYAECATTEGEQASRLAAIEQEGGRGDKSDHQVVNERYNQAVQFVMLLLAQSDELFNMATGTMGGDVKKEALESSRQR
jgi:hypothetical protein